MPVIPEYTSARMAHPPLGLVPPILLCDCFVSGSVACDGGHHNEVVFLNDLFHLLGGFEVPEHVPAHRLVR